MLMEKITGVFTFRQGVYEDVEYDEGFTSTAWLVVVGAAFLGQLGAVASAVGDGFEFFNWIIGSAVGTVFAVAAFALSTWVIQAIGKAVFNAEVDFGELVRTLGLAYVWQALGVIGIVNAFLPTVITCLLAPLSFAIFVLGLVAMFRAARVALDLDTTQTLVTVFLGWLVIVVFSVAIGAFLGFMGLVAAGAAGVLG